MRISAARLLILFMAVGAWLSIPSPWPQPRLVHAQSPGDCGPLLETITVPTDGKSVQSAQSLKAGTTYLLVARGTFYIGGPGYGDAEYAFGCHGRSLQDICPVGAGIDIGIGVDDPGLNPVKRPHWGDYSAAHTYEATWNGQGQRISLNYHDCEYRDNRGTLVVEVHEYIAGTSCIHPSRPTLSAVPDAARESCPELEIPSSAPGTVEFPGPRTKASPQPHASPGPAQGEPPLLNHGAPL